MSIKIVELQCTDISLHACFCHLSAESGAAVSPPLHIELVGHPWDDGELEAQSRVGVYLTEAQAEDLIQRLRRTITELQNTERITNG